MTLAEAIKIFENAGIDSPRQDALELFSHFLGRSRAELILSCPSTDDTALISAIERRAKREPLQYIIGNVCFYRENYEVSGDCLIPRSDTEILVDYAVRNIPEGEVFLDLCTGSGCVAISTLKNTNRTTAIAADISPRALDVARKNAALNLVEKRLTLLQCDVLEEKLEGEFYAVLSNPPYVTSDDYKTLAPEIYFEPEIAFVGGDDGLIFYRRVTEKYKGSLKEGGFIAYEIGYNQAEKIRKIAEDAGMSCEIFKDYSGNDRLAVLRNSCQ